MTENVTTRSKFCPEPTHLTEWPAEAAVVAVALDPDRSQTGKLASVFQTSKPPGSDSAVALALADVYWSCFQSPTEQNPVPVVF